jgi:hypothetical protein
MIANSPISDPNPDQNAYPRPASLSIPKNTNSQCATVLADQYDDDQDDDQQDQERAADVHMRLLSWFWLPCVSSGGCPSVAGRHFRDCRLQVGESDVVAGCQHPQIPGDRRTSAISRREPYRERIERSCPSAIPRAIALASAISAALSGMPAVSISRC